MPRSGVLGTYSLPPGTTPQQPNTTITSAIHNAAFDDVAQTLNTPTPVAYGGTGSSTPQTARAALGMEFPVIYKGDLGLAPPNLDTLYVPGIYSKNSSAGATIANGFPLDSRAGMLIVYNTDPADGTASYIVQRYQLADNRAFERFNAAAVWSVWAEVGMKPAFSAAKNAAQSIPSNTYTKVTFSSEDFDFGGYYDTSNSRFTPRKGFYRLSCILWLGGTDSGSYFELLFAKNGVLNRTSDRLNTPSGVLQAVTKGSILVEANGTDYFEVFTRHGNASPENLASNLCVFSGEAL